MPDDPYRPDPEQPRVDPELAKLAAEGERKLAAAHEHRHAPKAEHQHDTYIRQALGAYHGSPARKVSLALFALAAVSAAGFATTFGRLGTTLLAPCIPLFLIGLVGGLVFASVKALATPATVAAERQWLASLPFALDDYFELLAARPVRTCVLVADLQWDGAATGRPPDPDVVHGVAALWDAGVHVEPHDGDVELRSSWFRSGFWDGGVVETTESFGKISPNKRIPEAVHRLVDKVLLPLHKSHPIARVKLSRTDENNDRY